ncbi:MAG TPA: GNAT family N-acetyltransferase [Ilumatobacter sp.]|nr:GNAT family N-acetyltransferase [Ilumatobacter sp.]
MQPGGEWTSTVVLGDGETALIRPIRPDDAPALAAFHARQSAESRYRRYFSPKPALDTKLLDRFTHVDMADRAAFVVELHGEFVGWASYERWQQRDDAEVAFQVDDDQQGKGIATLLLEHLAALARANGLTRFTAQTLGENRGMLAVFARAGWPVQRSFDSGVVDIDFPIDDTAEYVDSVERREQRADSRAIARLLLPNSIAVIGASDVPGSIGATLWAHVAGDPWRAVYPVNPRLAAAGASLGWHTVHASVSDVPDEVGLAVVAVPPTALAAVVDECIAKRVRGAIVVTEPSTNDDERGVAFPELVDHARRNGLRIIGPASMGVASPLPDVALQAALVNVTVPAGGVAVSMQSGTLGGSLLRLAQQLELGLSWFVSLGDKLDVSANDLLQFWEDDEATRVICLYTESVGNGRKFSRIARRVALRRPIVLVRTGAAMVGPGNTAMYRQSGVIEVPTVTAMLDTARVLAFQPTMGGDRVAVLSSARSPRVLAEATLVAAELTPVAPPVTLDWRSGADEYGTALAAALADPGIDAVLVIHAPPTAGAVGAPTAAIDAVARTATKPVVAVMLGAGDGPLCSGSPVPSFAFPEQAAAVLGRVGFYSRWRAQELAEAADAAELAVDPDAVEAVMAAHLAGPAAADPVGPEQARAILGAYGVAMPPTVCVVAADAVAAAEQLGFPVALKAVHRGVGRSAEAGVALDLADASDVAVSVATMLAHLADGADPAGFKVFVQRMVPPGIDLRVQARDDPSVGPVVTAGLGGMQAELIGDEASRVAPLSPRSARALLADTRAASALLAGDREAVTDLLVRVAQLVDDHPEIAQLDLNPVIVADGVAQVADATITLQPVTRPERPFRRLEAT